MKEKYMIGDYVMINDKHPDKKLHNAIVEITGIDSENEFKEMKCIGSCNVKYAIPPKDRYEASRRQGIWNCFLQPIPLTESELLKLGFEKSKKDDRKYRVPLTQNCTITISESGRRIYFLLLGGNSITLSHTHQLQQLYYALTQTELKYKTP